MPQIIPIPGSDPGYDPYRIFPYFYQNPVIWELAKKPRWTWSKPETKLPVDMYMLYYQHKLTGCISADPSTGCVVDLPTLVAMYPNVPNHTLYLDQREDGYVCLDIEPECPDHIKQQLLHTPYLYGEYSLSGRGFHLFYKTPALLKNYPNAQEKVVMKEEHGWYEVLMIHAVTFTRRTIQLSDGTVPFDDVFEDLCAKAVTAQKTEFDITAERPDIPMYDQIRAFMDHSIWHYNKTLEDFSGDESRYEYGYEFFLYKQLCRYLASDYIKNQKRLTYDHNQRMWIVFLIAQEVLPHREKHDTLRDGLPLLLYNARNVVASYDYEDDLRRKAEQKERTKAERRAMCAAARAAKAAQKAKKSAQKSENKEHPE